jgi:Family of unknown function (DUF5906)
MSAERYVPTLAAQQAVQGRETEILDSLKVVWRNGKLHLQCPFPDHPDHNPSWRWDESEQRYYCACSSGDIFDIIGRLEGADFDRSKVRAAEILGRTDIIVDPAVKSKGLRLEEYAEAKRLPIAFLRELGLTEGRPYPTAPVAIRIPYLNGGSEPPAVRFRKALLRPKEEQFSWKKGSKTCLYGAHRIAEFARTGFAILVEGESDTHTLWLHDYPGLGLPGAGNWNEERDARLLADIPKIFAIIELDQAAEELRKKLARSAISSRVRLIRFPPEIKDPSGLYLANPREFRTAFQAAMTAAVPFTPEEMREATQQSAQKSKLDVLIDEFNAQYAVVNEAGKTLIYEQQIDQLINRNVLIRITFPDFKRLYQNRRLTVTTSNGSTTKSAAEWWLDSPRRRQYIKGVVFDPTGKTPATYWNLWTGFSVEPAQGDWPLMRDHIRKVIAAGNDSYDNYIMGWLALLFQKPEIACEVALVFRGEEGIGKGILCNWVVRAFGQHGIRISHAKHLVGSFNAHLRDCVALFGDEAFYAGDVQHEGILKGLITDPTLEIEGKYQNVVAAVNMLHIMLASNSDWVVPVSLKGRRFAIFDPADNRMGDRKYFSDIVKQMESGGLAAMIWDLLHYDLSGFEVRDLPNTQALVDQKLNSLDSLHKWWLTVLDRGFAFKSRWGSSVFRKWPASDFYSTELLWHSYLQWCDATKPFDRKSRVQLGRMMTKIYQSFRPAAGTFHPIYEQEGNDGPGKDTVCMGDRPHGYKVGSLEEARVRFSDIIGHAGEWGNDPS